MPQVHNGAKVLVTGASGFIGSWVVRYLLERDYSVRAAVRSAEKGEYMRRLYESYGDQFEYVVVADSGEPGTFDNVLEDIDAVEHHAAPITDDPDDFVAAAISGTTSLLESILRKGRSVKRVIVTSSGAALVEPKEPGYVYTEADWGDYSVKEVQSKGANATTLQKYRASKALAERAAWDFVEKHKDQIQWDVVTVLPTIVYGPIIHQVESPEDINYSNQLLYSSITRERSPDEVGGNWVDVRDVAEIHVELLAKRTAGGERYIVSAGAHSWQELYDLLNASVPPIGGIPRGQPGNYTRGRPPYSFSSEKVIKLLGIRFRALGESARDAITSIRERGM
ncbi:NAD P-binding protein [Gloeophyllum trabeum ATCC 11539]|uniref:NAD P-binding protein n=1 Tax=Gloeophyllum trabeum (strain ATCC 11539 / FP-39264 / Madison 617) TaxID=670483 RepID=S7QNE0_GLOTA|nr:NAD P-binding protein [Gloeophyllum trabeum ATCC 11539]EPQ61036.1 NAD P-binding protein [Gloeophyllum trabeum ATCC 11539]